MKAGIDHHFETWSSFLAQGLILVREAVDPSLTSCNTYTYARIILRHVCPSSRRKAEELRIYILRCALSPWFEEACAYAHSQAYQLFLLISIEAPPTSIMHSFLSFVTATCLAFCSINANAVTITYYCDGSNNHVPVPNICKNTCWGQNCMRLVSK